MCFGLEWFENLLIWLVIVVAVCAILSALLNFVLPRFPWFAAYAGLLGTIIRIFIGAVICIFIIIFAFNLIGCLGGAGLHLPGSRM